MPRQENRPIAWKEKQDPTLCEAFYKTTYAQGFSGVYRPMTHWCELKRLHDGPHYCFCNGYELTWYDYADITRKPVTC